jgi:hypothetical protein
MTAAKIGPVESQGRRAAHGKAGGQAGRRPKTSRGTAGRAKRRGEERRATGAESRDKDSAQGEQGEQKTRGEEREQGERGRGSERAFWHDYQGSHSSTSKEQ